MFMKLKISEKKFSHFLPEQRALINLLLQKYHKDLYLCGGSVRTIFDSTEIKDLDFFTNDPDTYQSIVQSFYNSENPFPRDRDRDIDNLGLTASFKGREHNIAGYQFAVCTFDILNKEKTISFKIQIIYTKEETVEDTLNTFDLTACMVGYDGKHLIATKQAIKDARKKLIRINSITRNGKIEHILRYRKEKGYTFSPYVTRQYREALFFSKLKDEEIIAG